MMIVYVMNCVMKYFPVELFFRFLEQKLNQPSCSKLMNHNDILTQKTVSAVSIILSLALIASTEAFFLKWGSDSGSQSSQKSWVQPVSPYRYQYMYPYESRKIYQVQPQQYSQPEIQMQHNMAPIPISVPAGASLTPVSLQHVQLVPCMCPVAPEEAEKLQEQAGAGPYIAQTYSQSYQIPQQMTVADSPKTTTKQ
ncbi:uncharacterized protein LOC123668872 [Melitaea cinxia]|uniref:uncharacterized protein LOC123668872 n=1 Tax=Melitaea cinxia TaxID=113334 RepID=UPI001E272B6D|nr:uncharacterized protein LOC123668872 [Melitaea cinxia]